MQEGKLGFWRWFWGAWGIGTYRKDDQVDVAWDVDGRPQVAHKLEVLKERLDRNGAAPRRHQAQRGEDRPRRRASG